MFVPQILFQLENGEGFTGVVEHGSNGRAGAMTGNLLAAVLLRDACLPAQKRDQHLIDISIPDALASIGKEKLHRLAGLWINLPELLFWSNLFPLVDALAHQRVDGFGVGSRGFVHRDLKEAGGVLGQDVSSFWDHHIESLPTHTSDP